MLQNSLRFLIFSNCVFKPTLLTVFTKIREMKSGPLVTIFKNCHDYVSQPIPEKPSILTEEAITPYLVWLRMNGTLSLHDWDKQVKDYADENCGTPRKSRTPKLIHPTQKPV
jgi:hypothetical protein